MTRLAVHAASPLVRGASVDFHNHRLCKTTLGERDPVALTITA